MQTLPLLAQPLCTVGWFAKTKIYFLAVQPIYPVCQNRCNCRTDSEILNPVKYILFQDHLHYILPFGLGGAVTVAEEGHPELINYYGVCRAAPGFARVF